MTVMHVLLMYGAVWKLIFSGKVKYLFLSSTLWVQHVPQGYCMKELTT